MTISHWIGLAGGLALFLYGIRLMGDGIQHLAGSKLKNALEKLTRNRIVGLFVGLFVTAIIQSSNATTSMAVGFVNAGLMDFARASSVILGANIGTTATGLLIALKISDIAPIIAFLGVILIVFIKNKHANSAGSVIAGLGILFIGMNMLKEFMQPLSCEPWFTGFMLSLESKPLLAIHRCCLHIDRSERIRFRRYSSGNGNVGSRYQSRSGCIHNPRHEHRLLRRRSHRCHRRN